MGEILPINLDFLVMKLFQEVGEEQNDLTKRINQIIEVQNNREQVNENL